MQWETIRKDPIPSSPRLQAAANSPEMHAIFVGLLVISLASVAILFAVKNTRLVLIGLIVISVTSAVVLGLALK